MKTWYVTFEDLVPVCRVDHIATVQSGHLQQPLRNSHCIAVIVACDLHSQFYIIWVEPLNDEFARRSHMPQFSPSAFRIAPFVVALILPPLSAFMSVESEILAFLARAACVKPASKRACLMM